MYLVFELEEEIFLGKAWYFPASRAENVQPLLIRLRNDRLPFTLSLAELASLREVAV